MVAPPGDSPGFARIPEVDGVARVTPLAGEPDRGGGAKQLRRVAARLTDLRQRKVLSGELQIRFSGGASSEWKDVPDQWILAAMAAEQEALHPDSSQSSDWVVNDDINAPNAPNAMVTVIHEKKIHKGMDLFDVASVTIESNSIEKNQRRTCGTVHVQSGRSPLDS